MKLESGTTSDDALTIQRLLNKALSRSRVREDGAVTDDLLDAIRTFQRSSGLKASGQPDARTIEALQMAASMKPPDYQVTIRGNTYLLSKQDYANLVKRIMSQVRREVVPPMRLRVSEARSLWDHFNRLNQRQFVVSAIIEATRGAKFPQESVIRKAENALKSVESATGGGGGPKALQQLHRSLADAERVINQALDPMRIYRRQMIEGGANWVTGLTITKSVAFTTLAILAIPATAGMSSGAVVSGAAAAAGPAAVESIATEVGHGFAGTSKGIGAATTNVLRDTVIAGAIGALTGGKAGGKIIEGVTAQIMRRASGRWASRISSSVITAFIGRALKRGASSALEGAVGDVLSQFRSRPEQLTWDKFFQNVAINMVGGALLGDLEDVLTPRLNDLIKKMPRSIRTRALSGLSDREIAKLSSKGLNTLVNSAYQASAERVLSKARGTESPKQLKQQIVDDLYRDRKFLERLEALASANRRR